VLKAFKTFSASIGNTDPEPISNIAITAWTNHYLPSDMRVFLFKLYNNRLKTNARASKFNQSINAGCTFCELKSNLPACKETIAHLFWDCTATNEAVTHALTYFLNFDVNKTEFFTGEIAAPSNKIKSCILSLFNVMQFITWEFKWQKKLPSKNLFLSRVITIWTGSVFCSSKLKHCILNSNLFNNMQR
jgi:zinc-binding in reverse transcriptase